MKSIKKDIQLIKSFWKYFKPFNLQIILIEIVSLISIGMQTVQPLIWGKVVVFLFEKDKEMFFLYTFYTMVIFLVNSAIDFFQSYNMESLTESVKLELKKDICNKILELPMKTINAINLGEVHMRLEGDTSSVVNGILNTIFICTNSILKVVILGIVILKMNFILSAIILIGTPITAIIVIKFSSVMRKLNKEALNMNDSYLNLVQQIIYGIREIRAIRIVDIMSKKYEEKADELKKKNMQLTLYENLYQMVGSAINFIMNTLILLIGGIMILNGTLVYEYYVAFSSYAQQFTEAYKKILNNNVYIQTTLNSIERLTELINNGHTNKVKNYEVFTTKSCNGNIKFKNVSFKYDNSGYSVKDINFEIKSNTTVGIVGKNGSGKSTILNLLLKLYDVDEGEILIDDVNINNISDSSMRRDLFPIMQNSFLFNATIRENFLLIKPDATEEEIINACKKAYIHEFVNSLPNKYDTKVGENGISMSGGQRQRLVLARSILKNAKILIFDEATSSIDKESVEFIKKFIKRLSNNHTIIVITHDTSIFDIFDKTIYIDEGKLTEIKFTNKTIPFERIIVDINENKQLT